MALNPVTFTEDVGGDSLRYQMKADPLADARLRAQMRRQWSREETRNMRQLKRPYVSLSRSLRIGAAVENLVRDRDERETG